MVKKIFVLLVVSIGFGINCFGQNTVIIQQNTNNNGSQTTVSGSEPNEVKGVEYSLEYNHSTGSYHLICENYNSFPVSCSYTIQSIYNCSYNSSRYSMGDLVNEQSGDFVIRANEKKDFDTKFNICNICKVFLKKFKSYRL